MSNLQYRLFSEENSFPVLYHYEHISEEEVIARFACDYFVKDGVLYEKTACATGPLSYIIYIRQVEDITTTYTDNMRFNEASIPLEIRHYQENADLYPLLFINEYKDHLQAALRLQSDFFMWQGREWRKTSAEIDEDRKVYVLYAEPEAKE
ncbi:hypothetical protein [Propionispora hippei]|uniref:Uncharacterized protein n=1 Tax=Propionispora hippei DSM 15287 TaxID=1123003 RepID=A0A1M6DWH2_9FIRM|nr:hypothetical protein [Propionispora hippei]SHI77525.1 hypothetical protein SAMN02745170_01026 [Propionispora hippei DSM 15287]